MVSAQRQRRFLARWLEQEKTPICTVASILATVVVWVIITLDLLTKPEGWGGLAQLFALVFLLVLGSLINFTLGCIAHTRGEYGGGRIAVLGTMLWFLTVAAFFFIRGNRLWS